MSASAHRHRRAGVVVRVLTAAGGVCLGACSSGPDGLHGAAVRAQPQSIRFGGAPALTAGGTTTVVATASSGLPVRYGSATPQACTVTPDAGRVTATGGAGQAQCTITADQSGDDIWAPAPQATLAIAVADAAAPVTFGPIGPMQVGGTFTLRATAASGLPVQLRSQTPAVCGLQPTPASPAGAGDGIAAPALVTALAAGTCTLVATQPGDATHPAAAPVAQSLAVTMPATPSAPGAPDDLSIALGDTPDTLVVQVGGTTGGGLPVSGYTIASQPAGITGAAAATPFTVSCGGACAGHRFTVVAANAAGSSPASAATDVLTRYRVTATFFEPDTQPCNTVFSGGFTLDSTTAAVVGLAGTLTQAMTGGASGCTADGGGMSALRLTHALTQRPGADGHSVLAATFLLDATATLSTSDGGDGWTPGSSKQGLYYGQPGPNPGNAYALVTVDTADPTAMPTAAQLQPVAYADCTPAGMMGAVCMTGTSPSAWGTVGTMSGTPAAQRTVRDRLQGH